jgi:hypothetical protein
MSVLTALDLLLEPDEVMRERATALNAALGPNVPAGFAFDRSHAPHVTLLQRYVRGDQMEQVLAAVEQAVPREGGASAGPLRAAGIVAGYFGTPPGTVLVSVAIEPTQELFELHDSLVRAVAPFAQSGGTAAAFFTGADEPEVNDATIAYVEGFVPAHSGGRYEPHMSVGVGEERVVARLMAAPFAAVTFAPSAVGAYRLGDLGTARQALRRWPL